MAGTKALMDEQRWSRTDRMRGQDEPAPSTTAADERLGRAAQALADPLWVTADDADRLLAANPATERLLGSGASRPVETWRSLVSEENRELLELAAARPDGVDCRFRTPTGEPRWGLYRRMPLAGASGSSAATVHLLTDITARKRVEQELRLSETRLARAVHGSSDGLWNRDLGSGEDWWSPRIYELLGYTPGAFEPGYEKFRELLHPDDRELARTAVADHLEHGTTYDIEYRLRTRSRGYRWFRARGQAVRDETGRPLFMAGSLSDVTERMTAAQALAASEARLRAALDALEGGVWDWNVQTGDVYYSARWSKLLGYEPEEIEQHVRPWERALHPDDREGVLATLQAHLDGRTPYYYSEHRLRTKSGSWVWVFGRGQVVERDAAGNALRMTGVNVDITERKQAEEERRRIETIVQQGQKLESLGLLAGGIAHDFNNLLTGILSGAELAGHSLDPASPARRHLEQIERSALRAADLCRQLLAYSGRGSFVLRPFDLSQVVQDMVQLLELSISKKARLELELAECLPAIEADVTRIRQVVMNLITNASEALGGAEGTITLRTSLEQVSGRVRLEVCDTGCGMDEATRARIFDPFFTTKFTGRGLGLAAVSGIVRTAGGSIEIESVPGIGTRFSVLFPASSRPAEPLGLKPQPELEVPLRGTVLVVDDDPDVRMLSGTFLEQAGLEVISASNGAEALARFDEHRDEIDAVLLDLTMPGMDGHECLARLRELSPAIPVLLSSGYSEQDVRARRGFEQASDFIQKPYRRRELLARVRDLLAQGGQV